MNICGVKKVLVMNRNKTFYNDVFLAYRSTISSNKLNQVYLAITQIRLIDNSL